MVNWRSADPSIVTVSPDGVVTACAEGITNVYADTARGTTLSCAVTVTNNIGRVSLSESRLYLPSDNWMQPPHPVALPAEGRRPMLPQTPQTF